MGAWLTQKNEVSVWEVMIRGSFDGHVSTDGFGSGRVLRLKATSSSSGVTKSTSERSIMKQTGHRSVQMVRRYIRDGSLFRENSAGKLGLSWRGTPLHINNFKR